MTDSHKDFDFSGLSPVERILLAQELWDSVHAEANDALPPVTEAQVTEIRRRVAEIDDGKVTLSSWDEVKARLRLHK